MKTTTLLCTVFCITLLGACAKEDTSDSTNVQSEAATSENQGTVDAVKEQSAAAIDSQ